MKTKLKSKLIAGELLSGCWLTIYNPVVTQIIAQAGYDVGLIDLEHGPGSYIDAQGVMPALEAYGCAAMLRVPNASEVEIKKAMDIGPMGIMVPNIRSAKEALSIVRATRYAPAGIRGAAPGIVRATHYGKSVDVYFEFLEKEFLLIGQIESKQAIEQIEEIADVDGLDMLFLGPADLSASLGELGNYTCDEFLSALEKLEKAAKQSNLFLGTIPLPTRSSAEFFNCGYQFVVSGTDSILLQSAADQDMRVINQARNST